MFDIQHSGIACIHIACYQINSFCISSFCNSTYVNISLKSWLAQWWGVPQDVPCTLSCRWGLAVDVDVTFTDILSVFRPLHPLLSFWATIHDTARPTCPLSRRAVRKTSPHVPPRRPSLSPGVSGEFIVWFFFSAFSSSNISDLFCKTVPYKIWGPSSLVFSRYGRGVGGLLFSRVAKLITHTHRLSGAIRSVPHTHSCVQSCGFAFVIQHSL